MLNVFGDVIKRFYLSQYKAINVDNCVAKLHYRITFWLLLASCTLVCSRQYFGDHIRCIVDRYSTPPNVVNTYCFFTSTYTLYKGFENASSHAHPGVSPHSKDASIIRHKYYQWVPFVLFGQALLFYLPHLIWKTKEKGTIRDMAEGLRRMYLRSSSRDGAKVISGHTVYSTQMISDIADRLHYQFRRRSRFRLNRPWSFYLIGSEVLNFVNVCLQMYALNVFLNGNFMDLGFRIMKNDPHDNPFDHLFPKVTKCDFFKYGPSGSVQKLDALCVMALNIINEKIYFVLWFWFVFLIPVSCAVLAWRGISFILHSRSERFNYHLMRNIVGLKLNSSDLALVTKHFHYSDWLFMCYLASNIDVTVFREFLGRLGGELKSELPSTSSSELAEDPHERQTTHPSFSKEMDTLRVRLTILENGTNERLENPMSRTLLMSVRPCNKKSVRRAESINMPSNTTEPFSYKTY